VLASVDASSFSQRGVQPRGRRLSETTTSACEQALVKLVQSIG
jgi:hypothetical protein